MAAHYVRLKNNAVSISLLSCILLALAAFLIYARVLEIGYVADDFDIFTALESSSFSFLDPLPAGSGSYYRPLTLLALLVEHQGGSSIAASIHHLAGIVIHAANGILLYFTCRLICGNWGLALGLGLLFVVHPAAVTPVYWIADRANLLLTFFFLAAIYSFVRFLTSSRPFWLLVTVTAVLASILTKETGILLPACLAILFAFYRYWLNGKATPRTQSDKWIGLTLAALFLLSAVYMIFLYQGFYGTAASGSAVNDLSTFVENGGAAFVLLLFPNSEEILRHLFYQNVSWFTAGAAALGIVLAVAAVVIVSRRTFKRPLLALLLLLLPLLAAVPVLVFARTATRHMYTPLALLCVAIACWVKTSDYKARRWSAAIIILASILALLSYRHVGFRLDNWQVYQAVCHSFNEILSSEEEEVPIIILAVPESYRSAPVLSNDSNRALFYCRHNRFGSFSKFRYLTPLVIRSHVPEDAVVILDKHQPGHFTLSLKSDDAYFLTQGPHEFLGPQPGSKITIDTRLPAGPDEAGAIEIEIADPEAFADVLFLYFDGQDFARIP